MKLFTLKIYFSKLIASIDLYVSPDEVGLTAIHFLCKELQLFS